TTLRIALLLTLVSTPARAQINAGELKPETDLPFTMTQVAEFKLGWRIAFLPDGRMLVTEKVGPVWLVTQQGEKTPLDNVPAVLWQGQGWPSEMAKRASRDCRCCGATCRRAGADSSAQRSRSRPTASTSS